jgi:hypothetical protein
MGNLKGVTHPGFLKAPAGSTYTDLTNGNIYMQVGDTSSIIWTLLVSGNLRATTVALDVAATGTTSGGTGTLSGTTGLTSTTFNVGSVVPITNLKLDINGTHTDPIVVKNTKIKSNSVIIGSINNVVTDFASSALIIKNISPQDGAVNIFLCNVGTQSFVGSCSLVLYQIG